MKVLVVVDMQNDFIDGVLGTDEAAAIVDRVAEKIKGYRDEGSKVIFTRDTHGDDYLETQEGRKLPIPHCIKGTPGWEIFPGLEARDSQIIDKPSFGSYELVESLEKLNDGSSLESVELVGVCTDICVISNAMLIKAKFPEITVMVDAACCAGVTPKTHDTALEAMEMCQIDIIGR